MIALILDVRYTFVTMDKDIRNALLQLNQKFYDQFSNSFSATRGRVQPGVRQLLDRMMGADCILDIGCGNGTLARALQKAGFSGEYLGLDMSGGLLEQAEVLTDATPPNTYGFQQVNLAEDDWYHPFIRRSFDWVVAFAVLHHIPGEELRRQIVKTFADLVLPEGRAAVSVWQWQNSPRLKQRVLSWSKAGLDSEKLDEGDVLLDWRAGDTVGLRYVHTFTEQSLTELAEDGGFTVSEVFYSDGRTGNLALYQVWQKKK